MDQNPIQSNVSNETNNLNQVPTQPVSQPEVMAQVPVTPAPVASVASTPVVEVPVAPVVPEVPVAPVAPAVQPAPMAAPVETPVAQPTTVVEAPAPTPVVEAPVSAPVVQPTTVVEAPVGQQSMAPMPSDNMSQVPGMQSMPQGIQPAPVAQEKKSPVGIIIGIILLVVIIAGVVGAYFVFLKPKSAKQVVNGTLDALFLKAEKLESKISDNLILDYKTQTIAHEGSLKLNLEFNNDELKNQFGTFKDAGFKYGLVLNAPAKELSFNVAALDNTKELLDLEGFVKNKALYVKSSLLDNVLTQDLTDDLDWDSLNVEDLPEIDTKSSKIVTEKLQLFIKNAIKEEYLSQEKGNYTVLGIKVDGYKTTVGLSEKVVNEIGKNILTSMKDDEEFINAFIKITSMKKEDIMEEINSALNDIDDEISGASTDIRTNLNIYTKTSGKFLACELLPLDEDLKGQGLFIVEDGDITKFELVVDEEKYTATYDSKSHEFKTTLDIEDQKVDLTFKASNDEYELKIVCDMFDLTVSAKSSVNNKKLNSKSSLGIKIKDANYGLNANVTYEGNVYEEKGIKTFDTKDAVPFDQMTNEQVNKLKENAMNAIKDTYLEKVFIVFSSLTNTSPEIDTDDDWSSMDDDTTVTVTPEDTTTDDDFSELFN